MNIPATISDAPLLATAQTIITSVAERLTKAPTWYLWVIEEGHHGYHQAMGAQRRCRASGD